MSLAAPVPAPVPATSRRPAPAEADFASAAMCRVLVRGMQALGLRLPGDGTRSEAQAARVPLADKRALVAAAVQQGGLVCLAQLGQGLHGLAFEPTHQALATAGSARGLFERWARLERYIHTRHRTLLLACEQGPAGGQALLRHVSRSGAPPLAAEDLVVLGVLAALLQALGLQQVQAWAGGVMVLPQADAAGLQAAAAVVHTRQASVTSRNSRNSHTSDWRLQWRGAAVLQPVAATTAVPGPRSELVAPPAWPPLAQAAARALLPALMQPPRLAVLAAQLGQPARSFQRALASAGLSYTRLLAETRRRAAAWWLLYSAVPLAEVGFIAGYADQAHFTRDFQRHVGLTPARYRLEFAGPAS